MTSKISEETLLKWKEEAAKATPKEWMIDDESSEGWGVSQKDDYIAIVDMGLQKEDALHIANSCPQNFLALIAELEAAREEIKLLRSHLINDDTFE